MPCGVSKIHFYKTEPLKLTKLCFKSFSRFVRFISSMYVLTKPTRQRIKAYDQKEDKINQRRNVCLNSIWFRETILIAQINLDGFYIVICFNKRKLNCCNFSLFGILECFIRIHFRKTFKKNIRTCTVIRET